MSGHKGFFAVGRKQWAEACEEGIGPASVYLVMACGTGRDHSTTSWSAAAALKYTGISWRRSKECIDKLAAKKLITKTKEGKKPSYKLFVPSDKSDLIWLPNTIVTGAGKEIPPVARLRQSQEPRYLQTFVELYALHDLSGDGGLPRDLINTPFVERVHICDLAQFKVYGFGEGGTSHCFTSKWPMTAFQDKVGKPPYPSWEFIGALERMGVLERVVYLAEGDSPDAELIHALSGDEHAEHVRDAAAAVAEELPGGFKYEAEKYEYVLPVLDHLQKATVVGIFRLVYRPHTTATSGWYAQHVSACTRFSEMYRSLAKGDYSKVA